MDFRFVRHESRKEGRGAWISDSKEASLLLQGRSLSEGQETGDSNGEINSVFPIVERKESMRGESLGGERRDKPFGAHGNGNGRQWWTFSSFHSPRPVLPASPVEGNKRNWEIPFLEWISHHRLDKGATK